MSDTSDEGSGGRNRGHKASKSKKKDKAAKGAGGFESCQGYVDEYGVWNNGFMCPRWGSLEEEYCCGTQHEKYCCPEPDPVVPPETSHHIPLIAGAVAGVLFIAVIIISCFVCRCCPGAKFLRRTSKPKNKKDKNSGVESQVCGHCHATLTSTTAAGSNADTLACGCPIGAPPGSHNHGGSHVGSHDQLDPDGFQQDVDMVLTLYENPAAHWGNEYDEMAKEMPCDEPPPYSENIMMCKHSDKDEVIDISPTTEETPMIHRLPPPHMLCMKTFRPLGGSTSGPGSTGSCSSSRPTSPLSPFSTPIMRTPRGHHHLGSSDPNAHINSHLLMDQSRRDSGVLVEEQESNHGGTGSSNGTQEDAEEQDNYNESIVVPKFNFQSLNLVNKSSNGNGGILSSPFHNNNSSSSNHYQQHSSHYHKPHHHPHPHLSGSMSSGGLSQSRTGGLSGSRSSRSRLQSRSSVESVELEHLDQLIESMNSVVGGGSVSNQTAASHNVPPV